jgi:hypothetical protein
MYIPGNIERRYKMAKANEDEEMVLCNTDYGIGIIRNSSIRISINNKYSGTGVLSSAGTEMCLRWMRS